uniref:Large ribosomal subunit protein eL14 domain-containing protein n=1 Tax=Oryza punctata TaxID=4537 RepID=A0A0E0KST9_ORYPU
MPFKRFVEIGRVALVKYGKDYGRLVVIVDVVDQNRALVDAPDMVRCQINFKRLSLTDIKIDIKRVPKKTTLIKAMEEADVKNKWENSSWGKKLIVQKRRASLNDFDRFKVMLAKIKRGGAIRQELAKLKKEQFPRWTGLGISSLGRLGPAGEPGWCPHKMVGPGEEIDPGESGYE